MLTPIPLMISATAFASPMRWPTAWLGFAFLMGVSVIPQNLLDVGHAGSVSVTRGIGMALVLCTVVAAPAAQAAAPSPKAVSRFS